MAPEEMAGPRYRGLGMSRWARTATLETRKSGGKFREEQIRSVCPARLTPEKRVLESQGRPES